MDNDSHPAAMTSAAEEAQTRAVLARNGAAFARGDIEAILANYAEDAAVIRPDRVYRGLEAIRGMFLEVLGNFEGFVPQGSTLTVAGRFALMTWCATSASGRVVQGVDTFVVEHDRIVGQSYFGGL
jgi:ketosteroid isomerase-like protein